MRRAPSALLVGLAVALGFANAATPSVADPNVGRQFIVSCKPGQRLADDPIVHPGRPDTAHLHQFFGSTATDANATVRELETAPTTCDAGTDTAAYWMPVVYRQGKPVTDLALTAYYRNTAANPAALRAYPEGLKMMAGNAMATKPQSLLVAAWSCRQPDGSKAAYFPVPPVCTTGRTLVMKVWFPDCWDGVHLDSTDHMSHLGYSRKGVCSARTPVNIPELVMTVKLDVPVVAGPPKSDGTAGYSDKTITLASGSVYTLHADFWNTWNQAAFNDLVRRCLIGNKSCPTGRSG